MSGTRWLSPERASASRRSERCLAVISNAGLEPVASQHVRMDNSAKQVMSPTFTTILVCAGVGEVQSPTVPTCLSCFTGAPRVLFASIFSASYRFLDRDRVLARGACANAGPAVKRRISYLPTSCIFRLRTVVIECFYLLHNKRLMLRLMRCALPRGGFRAHSVSSTLQHGRHARMMDNLTINGYTVPVKVEDAKATTEALASFKPLNEWVASIDSDLIIKSITIQSVDFFGKRLGFVKMKVDAALVSAPDKVLPGIVFLRGGAVAVLLLLVCDGEEWVVCCKQPRVPIGCARYLEIPAGMIDDSGHFAGVAAKELHEETSIELTDDSLVDLTAAAMQLGSGVTTLTTTGASARASGTGTSEETGEGARRPSYAGAGKLRGMYPSVGACDEFLRLYYARRYVSRHFLAGLKGRICGNADENESITLDLVRYGDLWKICPDAKTWCSMLLRERLLAAGVIADEPQTDANTLRELPPAQPR